MRRGAVERGTIRKRDISRSARRVAPRPGAPGAAAPAPGRFPACGTPLASQPFSDPGTERGARRPPVPWIG